MVKVSRIIVIAALVVSVVQVGTPSASASRGRADTYLALGTSLAVGFQPGRGETTKGYVDLLWERTQQQIPGLRLRNVGCPGETSRSMITGERSLCHYMAGSQLDAAVAYLEAHPGRVAFITVEVGANDLVERCLDEQTLLIERACAVELRPRLGNRIAHIVDSLREAAGPGVPIVGMNYYNPFLGLWALVPGGHALARADQRAWRALNAAFATSYTEADAAIADVATTFRIDDFEHTVEEPGFGVLPLNVALACRWTWFCSRRFTGDPHANRIGYKKIARSFVRTLDPLLDPYRTTS